MPVEVYLSTGRTPPRGTPRQIRLAVDIKTKLWPGIVPLLKSRCFRISDLSYYSVLTALARVGYSPEVVPLLRSAFCAYLLDRLDRKEAKFWIDAEVEAPWTSDYRPSSPMSPAEFAVGRVLFFDRESIERFVRQRPTPDHWRAELRRRGLRPDETVTAQEREVFAANDPGKWAAVVQAIVTTPRQSP
jgi:hypothetical protein